MMNYLIILVVVSVSNFVDASDIAELKHVFQRPVDFTDMTKTSLNGYEIAGYLEELHEHTKKLYIELKGDPHGSDSLLQRISNTIDLAPLHRLKHLEVLWLVADINNSPEYSLYTSLLKFTAMKNVSYSLQELHINLPLFFEALPPLQQMVIAFPEIQIIDLAGTRYLNTNGFLTHLCDVFKGKHLRALSVEIFQDSYQKDMIRVFNVTRIFNGLRSSPLEYLDISHNGIQKFVGSIVDVLPNLRILDISFNNLASVSNQHTLVELLALHPNLEILDANVQNTDDLYIYHGIGRQKRSTSVAEQNLQSIVELCMNETGTDNLLDIFHLSRDNFCNLIKCLIFQHTGNYEFYDFPCRIFPSKTDILGLIATTDPSCTYIKYPLSPRLTEVNLNSLSFFEETTFYDNNDIHVCFAKNQLNSVSISNSGPFLHGILFDKVTKHVTISGLNELHSVSLQNNDFRVNLSNSLFLSAQNLETIDLAGNRVQLNQNFFICNTFPKLKHIDLSYCELTAAKISRNLFKFLPITSINLAGNDLNNLELSLQNASELVYLNLSFSGITTFGEETISSLTSKRSQELTIDLRGNALLCSCNTMSVVELIVNAEAYGLNFVDRDLLTCTGNDRRKLIYDLNISDMRKECNSFYLIIGIIVPNVAIFAVCFITFVCYKYRYRLYTLYFRAKLKILERRGLVPRQNYEYDALISFASEDRFWVRAVLMEMLENKYGFKLFCRYRDSDFGVIADLIVENLKSCRCVLVILSNNYLKKEWCLYELQAAHNMLLKHGKRLIVLKLGQLDKDMRTGLVEQILDSRNFIECPDDIRNKEESEKRGKKKLFWAKIIQQMYLTRVRNERVCCLCWPSNRYVKDRTSPVEVDGFHTEIQLEVV